MAEPDLRTRSTTDSRLGALPSHLAVAVATGLVTTFLPVQRWRRPARWALHGGMAVGTGAATALALRRPDLVRRQEDRGGSGEAAEPARPLPAVRTAAVATSVAALVLGASRGGEAADAWVEQRLAARGVRRPRAWMGAAAAVASLAMSASDVRRAAQAALDAPT